MDTQHVSASFVCSLLAWLRSRVVCLKTSSSEALITWMVPFLTPGLSGLIAQIPFNSFVGGCSLKGACVFKNGDRKSRAPQKQVSEGELGGAELGFT